MVYKQVEIISWSNFLFWGEGGISVYWKKNRNGATAPGLIYFFINKSSEEFPKYFTGEENVSKFHQYFIR